MNELAVIYALRGVELACAIVFVACAGSLLLSMICDAMDGVLDGVLDALD